MREENIYRGMRNRAAGEMFEQYVDAACVHYSTWDIAHIEKTPEPMKVIRTLGNGQFVAVFKKSAQPDYKGITKNGIGIMFDAKHTDTDQIKKSALSEEQEKELLKFQSMQGITFVLVSIKFERFFRIPMSVWENMKEIFGHKYMTADEMKRFEIHIKPNGVLDFMEGLYETK